MLVKVEETTGEEVELRPIYSRENVCEVENCKNPGNHLIQWEEPYKPSRVAEVCRTHQLLNVLMTEKIGKFHNVMTVEWPKKILRKHGVLKH